MEQEKSTWTGKVEDLEKEIFELNAENVLLKAYANSEREKKSLYLDGLLAAISYVEAHFGIIGDWTDIKELEEYDAHHPDLSPRTFTHLQDLFGSHPEG